MKQNSEQTVLWQDFRRMLIGSRRLILTVLLTTVFSVYILMQLLTEVYEVKAKVLVKLGRENVEVPVTVNKGGVISSGVRMEEINSEVLLLTSRGLIEKAADKVGIERFFVEMPTPTTTVEKVRFYFKMGLRISKQQLNNLLITLQLKEPESDREKVIAGLQGSLKVGREKNSNVISISLKLPDPDLATDVLNQLLDLYHDRHVDVHKDTSVVDIFSTRSMALGKQIYALESERAELRNSLNLTSIDEERDLLLNRVQRLQDMIASLTREKALLPKTLSFVGPYQSTDKSLTASSSQEFSSPSVEVVKDRIAALQMDRASRLRQYDASAQLITDIDAEIAQLEALVAEGINRRLGPLQSQVQDIYHRLEELNNAEDKIATIERERSWMVERYLVYSKRLEEAKVSQDLDLRRVANIAILTYPQPPSQPVYPPKLKMLILSLPIGLLLGIGLALLLDYLNDTIRSRRDIESIQGLTYLGRFQV